MCFQSLWQDFFSTILWWILPCFVVKVTREMFRFSHIFQESTWRSCAVLFASIMSWMYLTTIILTSCMLFNLVCNLQVIHFDDYGKLLEQDSDPLVYLKEHLQLRHNLSKISHRFRMFLLLLFFSVTASQFAILFKTTAYTGPINFTNGGDIAVSSVVQVVGLVLCLHAAAKISHRAQNIASLASRWHALVTCSSDSTYVSTPNSSGNLVPFPAHMFLRDFSESDLESLESGSVQGNSHGTAQLASYMSSYHKRESLVLYLLGNPGGITIFGWIVDRTFLNTILMLELTLVLFVLSKTVVVPAKTLVLDYIRFPWWGLSHLKHLNLVRIARYGELRIHIRLLLPPCQNPIWWTENLIFWGLKSSAGSENYKVGLSWGFPDEHPVLPLIHVMPIFHEKQREHHVILKLHSRLCAVHRASFIHVNCCRLHLSFCCAY